jgi:hypothetical protein
MVRCVGVYPRSPLGVLDDGTPVMLRSWQDGAWVAGFEIAGTVTEDNDLLGYRVRSVADASVLRAWVSPDDVMPVRRSAGVTGLHGQCSPYPLRSHSGAAGPTVVATSATRSSG